MKLYSAHQISGLSYEAVKAYYDWIAYELGDYFTVLCPMTAKGALRTEVEFKAHGYGTPISSNHAIIERDHWMVAQADVLLVDLSGMTQVSIGCMMELAWGYHLGKHTVVVMEPTNPQRHAFVLEAADIVFERTEDAVDYLKKLSSGAW